MDLVPFISHGIHKCLLDDDPIHGQHDNEVEEEDKENYDNQTIKNNTRKNRSKKLFEGETNSTSTSHPVYKEISLKNGFINRQDLSTLKRICKVNAAIISSWYIGQ